MELSVVAFWGVVRFTATPPSEKSLPESVKAKLSAVVRTFLGWVRLGAPGMVIMSIVLVFGLFCCSFAVVLRR
jgi:hypothetical protein